LLASLRKFRFMAQSLIESTPVGAFHHTITERAFPEIRRVLKPGGKFAAIEPWRAPGYRVGIRVFGKRERGVNCRPMELERVLPLFRAFDDARVTHHGTFTRYSLIALGKLGVRPRIQTIDRITRIDDNLASKSSLRKYGSSVRCWRNRQTGPANFGEPGFLCQV
jgi:hypothetical protein